MATVHQFIDGFNKGDVKTAVAACADQASVIDEFPPYEWHGAGACAQWAADFDADAKKNGITPGAVTLGKTRHLDITGDRAYVVVPTEYAFKQKGKAVRRGWWPHRRAPEGRRWLADGGVDLGEGLRDLGQS